MHVTVVGAGVSGLTTAAALVEAGWSVDIVARERHPDTVSVVAAAIWTTTTAEPQVRVRQWALTTRERFATIAADSSSGIAPLMQREFERVDPGPLWWESTPFVRRLGDHELPPEYAAGFEIDGFIVEPPIYLDWLTSRLVDQGVTITTNAVTSLEDLEADVIVNCAGLAARDLVGDDTMFPIRGQVVAVANPGINEGVSDESDADRVAYIYPRSNEVILGGARQIGNEQMVPDDDLTARILSDGARLDPRVSDVEVLDVRVGLRPGRPEVRVEAGVLGDGRPVVHNYGHSGAGFLLSWGCALDVVDLVTAAI
ncbi:FAD-binding oxidoreductase [bacterium]|nr:FAD-binding oxidoreductase [bacterium]MDC0349873.1 FAD-binding oxidoreductase [bacterium]